MPYDDLGSIFKISVLGSPAEMPILYVRRGTQKSVHCKIPQILPVYCSRIIHLLLCPGYSHRPEFLIFFIVLSPGFCSVSSQPIELVLISRGSVSTPPTPGSFPDSACQLKSTSYSFVPSLRSTVIH